MIPNKLQKIAVALKYKYNEDTEPRVVAGGKGRIAEAIIHKAEVSQVPIHEDRNLALVLSEVEIGEPVPEELYDIVAQLIAMIYNMEANIALNSTNFS